MNLNRARTFTLAIAALFSVIVVSITASVAGSTTETAATKPTATKPTMKPTTLTISSEFGTIATCSIVPGPPPPQPTDVRALIWRDRASMQTFEAKRCVLTKGATWDQVVTTLVTTIARMQQEQAHAAAAAATNPASKPASNPALKLPTK